MTESETGKSEPTMVDIPTEGYERSANPIYRIQESTAKHVPLGTIWPAYPWRLVVESDGRYWYERKKEWRD